MINKRLDDLSVVFDKRWKASHNDDVKLAKERDKNLYDKMYNTSSGALKPMTPGDKVNNLQSNMNNAFNGQMKNKVNNIVGKFK